MPLLGKSQKIVGALVGAPVLDLKNRGCLAPMAPTLKRPLKSSFYKAGAQPQESGRNSRLQNNFDRTMQNYQNRNIFFKLESAMEKLATSGENLYFINSGKGDNAIPCL